MNKSYLLDVNVLVALLWNTHTLHARTNTWFSQESPEVFGCAFTELSFLRISMADKTIGASFADANKALTGFIGDLGHRYHFINILPSPASFHSGQITSQKQVSDWYLCELAKLHRLRLATLDTGIKHPLAVLIA